MSRATIVAASIGALVAAIGLYAASEFAWHQAVANWLSAPGTAQEAKLPIEEWPICTTMGSIGPDIDLPDVDPDFVNGKRALAVQDWTGALSAFKLAALRDPRNADIQNYIGYSYRRLRQLGPAMGHYQQALALNPRHRSAHEHLGELYLVLRERAKAEGHLAELERICLIPCSEFSDLQRAISTYNTSANVR